MADENTSWGIVLHNHRRSLCKGTLLLFKPAYEALCPSRAADRCSALAAHAGIRRLEARLDVPDEKESKPRAERLNAVTVAT